MRKSKEKLVVVVTIVLLFGLAAYSSYPAIQAFFSGEKPMISIANFYDRNGNKINAPLAIVNDIEAVYAMDFDVNLKSLSSVPLTISLSGTPPTFNSAVSIPSFVLQPNASKTVRTNRLNVSQLAFGVVPLVLTAKGSYFYGGQSFELSKTGSLTLNVEPDPVADFTVSLSGQSSTPSGITADYIVSRGMSIDFNGLSVSGDSWGAGSAGPWVFSAVLNGTKIDLVLDSYSFSGGIGSSGSRSCIQSLNEVSCSAYNQISCNFDCFWSLSVDAHAVIPTTQPVGLYNLVVHGATYKVSVQ